VKEKEMIRDAYAVVMDDEKNAFSLLPKVTRFQIMTVLSLMWSAVFTAYIGSYIIFGPTVIAHLVVLLAIFFTADVFRRAEKQFMHHRDAMRNKGDGTAMHDDLWGAP
jgi:predicted Na+-dependent transporter